MRESIREILARPEAGGEVSVQGWVRTARHGKKVSFLEVNDGSSLSGVQVVVGPECPGFDTEVRGLGTGCAVEAMGKMELASVCPACKHDYADSDDQECPSCGSSRPMVEVKA